MLICIKDIDTMPIILYNIYGAKAQSTFNRIDILSGGVVMGLMNFLSVLLGGSNSELSESDHSDGLLSEPGDYAEARVTETNRKVLKVSTDGGKSKYSATQYPNGTIVETKTTKK